MAQGSELLGQSSHVPHPRAEPDPERTGHPAGRHPDAIVRHRRVLRIRPLPHRRRVPVQNLLEECLRRCAGRRCLYQLRPSAEERSLHQDVFPGTLRHDDRPKRRQNHRRDYRRPGYHRLQAPTSDRRYHLQPQQGLPYRPATELRKILLRQAQHRQRIGTRQSGAGTDGTLLNTQKAVRDRMPHTAIPASRFGISPTDLRPTRRCRHLLP